MKYFIILAVFFLSVNAKGQSAYDATLTFPMTDTTDEAGTILKRKGYFMGFDYNQKGEGIVIKVQVRFLNNTTELKRFTKLFNAHFTVNNNVFVVTATGAVIGDRQAMRTLYGVIQTPADPILNTPAVWRQSVLGGDSLTTPCMGQYTYLTSQFDVNNKLHLLIKNLCVAAVAEGKLNED